MIIGGYESGMDAAVNLASAGKRCTVLASTPYWKVASADPSAEDDPLASLPEADEFWTEEVPMSELQRHPPADDTDAAAAEAPAASGEDTDAAQESGGQLDLFTRS